MTRLGLQNQAQKAPKIEAKSLPGGFKMASKRVPKKASILDPIFNLFLSILEPPGGRSVKMASKIASKTALASNLGLSTPGSPPGAHFGSLGGKPSPLHRQPGQKHVRLLRGLFQRIAPEAKTPRTCRKQQRIPSRLPRSAWLRNGGRR